MSIYLIITEYGDIWKTSDKKVAEAAEEDDANIVISLDELNLIGDVPDEVVKYLLEDEVDYSEDLDEDEED